MDFQNMYFTNSFPPTFGVTPDPAFSNAPELLFSRAERNALTEQEFILAAAEKMAQRLHLAPKDA
jgi:threonine synthase